MDDQILIETDSAIRYLQKTANKLTAEIVLDDDVLYRAVLAFNAIAGRPMLYTAEMTQQRRRLIFHMLCTIYTLVEASNDNWVRRDLAALAEKLDWKDESKQRKNKCAT